MLWPVFAYNIYSIGLKSNHFGRLLRFFLQQVTNILHQQSMQADL